MAEQELDVAVLGGGIGGLTAAHELVDLAYTVHVYERDGTVGGKARSHQVSNLQSGWGPLPAEHGFRLFPGYYRHLDHTMARIKGADVKGRLRDSHVLELAGVGVGSVKLPTHPPDKIWEFFSVLHGVKTVVQSLTFNEIVEFLILFRRMLKFSAEQWDALETKSWWDLVGGDEPDRSTAYKKYLADGMNRRTVAARGTEANARTVGRTFTRLWRSRSFDRVLDGPTSEVWLEPWRRFLESRGVVFHLDSEVTGFTCVGDKIDHVTVKGQPPVRARHFIAALPVEVMQRLVTADMKRIDDALDRISKLETRWMAGAQFYLGQADVRAKKVDGHTAFVDSPLSITSIFQAQTWQPEFRKQLTDVTGGEVHDVLSVCLSDWKEACPAHAFPYEDHTRTQILDDAWAQVTEGWAGSDPGLPGVRLASSLDPAITDRGGHLENATPLLINMKGDWINRPEAESKIANLCLASDYVRTFTDLATMEAANEAARRAVTVILRRDERAGRKTPMDEPFIRPWEPTKGFEGLKPRMLTFDEDDLLLFEAELEQKEYAEAERRVEERLSGLMQQTATP